MKRPPPKKKVEKEDGEGSAPKKSKVAKGAASSRPTPAAQRSKGKEHAADSLAASFSQASKNHGGEVLLTGLAKFLIRHQGVSGPDLEARKRVKALERELEAANERNNRNLKDAAKVCQEKKRLGLLLEDAEAKREAAAKRFEKKMAALEERMGVLSNESLALNGQIANFDKELGKVKESADQKLKEAVEEAVEKASREKATEYNSVLEFTLKNTVAWLCEQTPSLPLEQCPSLQPFLKKEAKAERKRKHAEEKSASASKKPKPSKPSKP